MESPGCPQPSTLTGGSTCRMTQRAFHSATACCASFYGAGGVTALAAKCVTDHPTASTVSCRPGRRLWNYFGHDFETASERVAAVRPNGDGCVPPRGGYRCPRLAHLD